MHRHSGIMLRTLAACLAIGGFGNLAAPAGAPDMNLPADMQSRVQTKRRVRKITSARHAGSTPAMKHIRPSSPAKHTSRAKAKKRARCKVKRRSHR